VAYYFSGRMCQLLRDYACAAANFGAVAEGWPDYRYAGGAQCAVGYCYAAIGNLKSSLCLRGEKKRLDGNRDISVIVRV